MILVSQVSGFVENFNIRIFLDTINMTNIKLCMIVLLIELHLLIPLSVTLTIWQGHSNVKQFKLKIKCKTRILFSPSYKYKEYFLVLVHS